MTRVLESRRTVVPDSDGFAIRHARVHLNGPTIARVELDPTTPAPEDADDLGDRLLTPAFVNAHTHLALVAMRGPQVGHAAAGNVVESLFFRMERALTPADVHALSVVGAYECLLTGTACVWDHYYHADAVAQALEDVGLGGIVGPALQDLSGPGMHGSDAALETTTRLARDARRHGMGIGACLAPHATDTVSDALFRTVADTASRLNLPVHLHVGQSIEEVRRAEARCGSTPLGILLRNGVLDAGPGWLLVHGLFVTDEELRQLDPTRHTWVSCPSAQALFGFPAHVPAWERLGQRWVVATDCAAANDSMNVQKELRALAAYRTNHVGWSEAHKAWRRTGTLADAEQVDATRRHGFEARARFGDPTALLHRVWTLPGALHPNLRCGAIAPGHLAHFALWNTEHPAMWPGDDVLRALALGDPSPALCQMMVAGRWRGERDDFHRSLLREPTWVQGHREAKQRCAALLQRAH